MNDAQQNRLLEAAREIAEKEHTYTARELLMLPRAERELIVQQAFQQAQDGVRSKSLKPSVSVIRFETHMLSRISLR